MISSDANLNIDKASGTINLTSTPTDIRRVAKYINEQNNRVSKQVAISVKVIQLSISNADKYNLDLKATLQWLSAARVGALMPQCRHCRKKVKPIWLPAVRLLL